MDLDIEFLASQNWDESMPERLAWLRENDPVHWSEKDFADHLNNQHGLTVSSEAGFVVGTLIEDEAEIITLGVLPDYRKEGHGTDLLTQFEKRAKSQGADMIFLEVAADNEAALALYAEARRWHVMIYQAMSAAFTPQYQSDSRWLPVLRDRVLYPLSQVPPGPKLLTAIVCGTMLPPLGNFGKP